ncbi:MAG: type II and III secretion system protein family protein [Phycisphaerae bacterium]
MTKLSLRTHGRLKTMAALCAAFGAWTSYAQEDTRNYTSAPLKFKVSQVPSTGQLINVAVNKGALVDFEVPISEVRIANADIATVTATGPTQVLVNGKSFGTTQLVVWTGKDQQQVFDVAVDLDMDRLRASLRGAAPRADIRATSVLDTVVLSGTVQDVEAAQRIMQIAGIYSQRVINHMRVAGVQQVLLRCTIAEMNRSATRQLGFNGWLGGENFRDAFGLSQIDGINPINIGAAAGAPITTNVPFITGTEGIPVSGSTTLSLGFPRAQLQVFIRALRENSLLRVLAEPNLVTVSGQEASFLAGGEYPIPVPQGGQNNAITIEYREFGVRLNFTPVVVSDGLIRLQVAPEVSELDFSNSVAISGFAVPGLTSRRVETTVEMANGQTLAIGGLLSQETRAVSRAVPALGDIPVLGALFRSVEYRESETELVVLVTPELVAPLYPDQVTHVPGAQFAAPNDYELFVDGKLEGKNSVKGNNVLTQPGNGWPANPQALYGTTEHQRLRGPIGPAGIDEGM